ncbi:hypothetical protein ES703_74114 [subsurface metagenome]
MFIDLYLIIPNSTNLDSQNTYRESYRKLSGGSIITPFEYSLSIDAVYNLYLSYRLNLRDYYEEKFEIKSEYYDSGKSGYVYEFMPQQLNNYVDVLEIDGENAISVYYFDNKGRMKFLDASHYELDVGSRQITIKNDGNELVSTKLLNREFYVSFIPRDSDRELSSYRFTYDPSSGITSTLTVTNWNVIGVDGLDVIPNLDAYYFMNENETTLKSVVCHASQIAAYLGEGKKLEFNLAAELESFDQDLLTGIQSGDYLALYIDTNIKNIESLEHIMVELYDNQGLMSGLTQVITIEDLIMFDNNLKINLPTTSNTLKTIKLIPSFRIDEEYSEDNSRGIVRIQTAQWDNKSVTFMEDGQEYMHIELDYDLMVNNSNLAYIFNDKLDHLTFSENYSVFYTFENVTIIKA